MIDIRPYDDHSAWAVFQNLDPWDWAEAEMVRGAGVSALSLFADWRGVQPIRVLSHVILTERGGVNVPLAVLGLSSSGQAGVAEAAFLARRHDTNRRALAETAIAIRDLMPGFCRDSGVARIEARCWSRHPTAARFLTAIGFRHEADLPGFPPKGAGTFRQFAFVPAVKFISIQKEAAPCA